MNTKSLICASPIRSDLIIAQTRDQIKQPLLDKVHFAIIKRKKLIIELGWGVMNFFMTEEIGLSPACNKKIDSLQFSTNIASPNESSNIRSPFVMKPLHYMCVVL